MKIELNHTIVPAHDKEQSADGHLSRSQLLLAFGTIRDFYLELRLRLVQIPICPPLTHLKLHENRLRNGGKGKSDMSDWLHRLPVAWMAVVVFGATYLFAAAIYATVMSLASGERARAFKAVSPGMLPPLGILFALFVAFTAAQVWNDNDRAGAVVDREASALRSVVILAAAFPGDPQTRLYALVRRHIEEVATREWPMMAHETASLSIIPPHLVEALQLTLALTPGNAGQQTAQREMVIQLESALDARRQRILISRAHVRLVKWACLLVQAICALFAIALVHSDNRLAAFIMMGVFATGVAACVLLIAAYDRPFLGQLAINPDPLLQVMPEAP